MAPALTLSATAPEAAVAPAAAALPTLEPVATQSGLTKRVRGAQMPDLGSVMAEPAAPRPADEVRNTLASLQRGVDLGRQRNGEG